MRRNGTGNLPLLLGLVDDVQNVDALGQLVDILCSASLGGRSSDSRRSGCRGGSLGKEGGLGLAGVDSGSRGGSSGLGGGSFGLYHSELYDQYAITSRSSPGTYLVDLVLLLGRRRGKHSSDTSKDTLLLLQR